MQDSTSTLAYPGRPKSRTLADQAYDTLADALVRGELPLGSRLSEDSLSRRYGISRGPLREALRRLEGRKLVVVKPNAGASVVSLSINDIAELYQIRESLEALACQLATERMTDAELDELERLLDQHDDEPAHGRASSRAADVPDFHTALVMGSKSRWLIDLVCGQLFDLMRVYRFRSSGQKGRAPVAFDEHRQIMNAIRSRDAARAASLMREHVRRSRLNALREEGVVDLAAATSEAA